MKYHLESGGNRDAYEMNESPETLRLYMATEQLEEGVCMEHLYGASGAEVEIRNEEVIVGNRMRI